MGRRRNTSKALPSPLRRSGSHGWRMLWLILTAVFFGLIVLALWVYAYTPAREGDDRQSVENHVALTMGETLFSSSLLTVGYPVPSSFRSGVEPHRKMNDPPVVTGDSDGKNFPSEGKTRNDEIVYHRRNKTCFPQAQMQCRGNILAMRRADSG